MINKNILGLLQLFICEKRELEDGKEYLWDRRVLNYFKLKEMLQRNLKQRYVGVGVYIQWYLVDLDDLDIVFW